MWPLKTTARRTDERGQFLVELLVAIVILAAGLTVLLRSFLTNLQAASDTVRYTKAVMAAENAFAETLPFAGEGESAQAVELDEPFAGYRAAVARPAMSAPSGLSTAQVTISWEQGRRRVSAATYVLGGNSFNK